MATTEHTINDALAEILMETRSLWRLKGVVKSENIDVLKGSGKRPDVLITEPNVSPVVVETEVLPAPSVESDAKQRLGEKLMPSAQRILSSLAIRLPLRLRDFAGQSLKDEIISATDFEMALLLVKIVIFYPMATKRLGAWHGYRFINAYPISFCSTRCD